MHKMTYFRALETAYHSFKIIDTTGNSSRNVSSTIFRFQDSLSLNAKNKRKSQQSPSSINFKTHL